MGKSLIQVHDLTIPIFLSFDFSSTWPIFQLSSSASILLFSFRGAFFLLSPLPFCLNNSPLFPTFRSSQMHAALCISMSRLRVPFAYLRPADRQADNFHRQLVLHFCLHRPILHSVSSSSSSSSSTFLTREGFTLVLAI